MDVLIIGNGGREHTIAYSLKKSPKVDNLFCISGNGGIESIATCVNIDVLDFQGILDFLQKHPSIGMTVVAPDDPLSLGLVDLLMENGFNAFGPRANAAIIEASKTFSKDLMLKYGIPTASYATFDDYALAKEYVKNSKYPLVVKADGLALGKGVIICQSVEDANTALIDIMINSQFGKAGKQVVIEEFLVGKEVSILAFCDGKTIIPMVSSQDHKRALDGDNGLNTGGMGTFSPSKAYTKEVKEFCEANIFSKTMDAMNSEGREFRGVLYFGLMLTSSGIKVLEYNARFGDPETQVILPLLETDLFDIFEAVINQKLDEIEIKWSDKSAVCVILASGGYPQNYAKGIPISIGKLDEGIMLFHAGTKLDAVGSLITNGGRVIGVTAVGESIDICREKVYNNISKINFKGMHYRKDIGIKI